MRISLLLFGVSLLVFIVACTGQLPMAIADVERADAIDTNSMANVEQNTNVSPPDSPAALRIVDTEIVTQLTGSASPNATDAVGMYTARILAICSTTRANSIWFLVTHMVRMAAIGAATRLRVCPIPILTTVFRSRPMIESATGAAKEIIQSAKIPGFEWTVIPTNGLSLGERMVLHYMSVRMWGADDKWYVRRSGLAYSDDDGQNWTQI